MVEYGEVRLRPRVPGIADRHEARRLEWQFRGYHLLAAAKENGRAGQGLAIGGEAQVLKKCVVSDDVHRASDEAGLHPRHQLAVIALELQSSLDAGRLPARHAVEPHHRTSETGSLLLHREIRDQATAHGSEWPGR